MEFSIALGALNLKSGTKLLYSLTMLSCLICIGTFSARVNLKPGLRWTPFLIGILPILDTLTSGKGK